jgi:hypothetical protein
MPYHNHKQWARPKSRQLNFGQLTPNVGFLALARQAHDYHKQMGS